MICLRPYQLAAIEAIRAGFREHRAILLALPTGSGKTILFAHVAHGAASKGNQVLILSHRIELIDQISQALTDADTPHGIIAADYPYEPAQCLIASVATLARRSRLSLDPRLIIIDEAHHATAATWKRTLERWPRARVLGVTATPVRTDGAGLGDIFTHLIVGPQVPELQALGFLAPLRVFAPATVDISGLHRVAGDFNSRESSDLMNRREITGSALAHYRKHADGKRALVFVVSIAHAAAVAQQFREAGYSAAHLSGDTAREIRRAVNADFKAGALQVLISCDLFSEGYDVPGAEVGIMLRPTMSLGLYRQQVGRIMRPTDGKTAILLDHVNNTERHGLPDEPIEWDLTCGADKAKRKTGLKLCPRCYAALRPQVRVCTECGHEFTGAKPREIEEVEGELAEVTAKPRRKTPLPEAGRLRTLAELEEFGRMKGFAPGWARHRFEARQRKAGQRAAEHDPC